MLGGDHGRHIGEQLLPEAKNETYSIWKPAHLGSAAGQSRQQGVAPLGECRGVKRAGDGEIDISHARKIDAEPGSRVAMPLGCEPGVSQ